MNAEELKRVEDLKKDLKFVLGEIADKRDVLRLTKIEGAMADFTRFFTDKEFEVEAVDLQEGRRITATDAEHSAEISVEPFDTHYEDTSFRFDLKLAVPQKTECYVTLHGEVGSGKVIVSDDSDPTEEEVSKAIELESELLKNVDQEEWFYMLNLGGQDVKQFQSMYQILEYLVK